MISSSEKRREEIIEELKRLGWQQQPTDNLSRLVARCFSDSRFLRVSPDSFSEEELFVMAGFFASAPRKTEGLQYDLAAELLESSLSDNMLAQRLRLESDWDKVKRDREIVLEALHVVESR